MPLKCCAVIIFTLTVVLFSSCVSKSDDIVTIAEEELAAGRVESAQALCDSIVAGPQFDRLSVAQLCRLSLLASHLAEVSDEVSDLALASNCMRVAMQRDPDSVLVFVHSLPADDQSRSLFIRQLSGTLDPDYKTEIPADSLFND